MKHDRRDAPKDPFGDEFSRPIMLDPKNKIIKSEPTKGKLVTQGEAELEPSVLNGFEDHHAGSSITFLTKNCQSHFNRTGLPDDKIDKAENSIPIAFERTGYTTENTSPRFPAFSNVSTGGTDIPIVDDYKTEGSKDLQPEILTTETTGGRDNKIGEDISPPSEVLTTDITCETARNSDLHSTVHVNDVTNDNDYQTQENGNPISGAYTMNTSGGGDNKIEENNGLTSEVNSMGPLIAISPPSPLCEAYNNMFLIFYGLPHNISTENIMIALSHVGTSYLWLANLALYPLFVIKFKSTSMDIVGSY
jgi:hypothetical protein